MLTKQTISNTSLTHIKRNNQREQPRARVCLWVAELRAVRVCFHMHNCRSARVFAGAALAALTFEHRPPMTGVEKKKKGLKRGFRKKK